MPEVTDEQLKEFIAKYNGSVTVFHDQYSGDGFKRTTIKNASLKEALFKIHNKMLYGYDQEALDENEIPEDQQELALLQDIDSINGDGCDYILSLTTNGYELTMGCVEEEEC